MANGYRTRPNSDSNLRSRAIEIQPSIDNKRSNAIMAAYSVHNKARAFEIRFLAAARVAHVPQ